MAMKIEKIVLKSFLQKVQMVGEQQIMECILDFSKEGLKISANSPSKQARAMGWLKVSAFKTYDEIGQIGVNGLDVFIKVIDRFDDVLNITHSGNLLTVTEKTKTVDIELTDISFISSDNTEPKMEFLETFELPASKLEEIFTDAKLNKDAIIEVTTEKKKLKISNSGKYKFQHIFDMPTCNGGVNVKFGQPLIDAVTNLEEVLTISINTNYPIKLMEKTENSVVTLLVAPRVENDESE